MNHKEKEDRAYDLALDVLIEVMEKRSEKTVGKMVVEQAKTAFNGYIKREQTQNGKMTNLMIYSKMTGEKNVAEVLNLNGIEIVSSKKQLKK